MIDRLDRGSLHHGYRTGAFGPQDVVAEVLRRIADRGDDAVWIHLVDPEEVLARAQELAERFPGPDLPALYGLPFAVKDNIDVAGMPTTAACPDFAYLPDRTAPVVQRAIDAGAILVGKANLDQFAAGLSGTRSPYGVVRNPFDPSVIAGGSSSGSAVAVAAGLVSFALGTDTAGSGRVPAGLTGTVGVKPSRGLVSTRGIVPACRSLDCPSVFALTVADGAAVLATVAGPDPADPYSRQHPVPGPEPEPIDPRGLRIGVPAVRDVAADFDGDAEAADAFESALRRMSRLGATLVPTDLAPFLAVGRMLYQGPWLAERGAALGDFISTNPESLHPVTRQVLSGADQVSGTEVFRGLHALASAQLRTRAVWDEVDALLLPTAPTAPTVERLLADPLGANTVLGRYTNFVNLLDLSGVAVPSEVARTGVPIGVTFLGPAGADSFLLGLAQAWQVSLGSRPQERPVGAAPARASRARPTGSDEVLVAVVGAHMAGEPLHDDLLALGGRLHSRVETAPAYRLFALPTSPGALPRPGLVRVEHGGAAIEAEVYRLPVSAVGRLLVGVPAPLGIGSVRLADGSEALGFLCEAAGTVGATDITVHGGWRAFRRSLIPA